MIFRRFFYFIALLLTLAFLWLGVHVYYIFYRPVVKSGVVSSFKIYPNDQLSTVVERLVKAKIIQDPILFTWLVDITKSHQELRYGEYKITANLSQWQLLQNMTQGTGLVQHRVTLVNGWTFDQVRSALASHDSLQQTIGDQVATTVKDVTGKKQHPEGLFYPDTYFFTWGNADISILKTAHEKMKNTLADLWKNRSPDLPYKSSYQALILASLIERETSIPEEKQLVASVILNRLKRKMRLQIDPTVQYGLGKSYGSVITKKDLSSKTAYNTYVIKGLPPTPICMPSRSSIEAALNPAKTDYLYYVATGTGGHRFSKTYREHKKAVEQYRQFEREMKQDTNQLEVWLHNGLEATFKTVIVITYLPFIKTI